MHATLPLLEHTDFPPLKRTRLEILQVNLGYRCNQSCLHCHVNAGPMRNEQMSPEIMEYIVAFVASSGVRVLDITGGAPELHDGFTQLVEVVRGLDVHVIDRCNLTILNEPGFERMAAFLAQHQVEIVASLPCYLEENVESQRGKAFTSRALQRFGSSHAVGYGQRNSGLLLNLMHNPGGAVLPPPQKQLEADYRRELANRAGVEFNQLFVLANMPIQRFGSTLISKRQFAGYMELLKSAHQDSNLDTVMCRSLISVDWQGFVFDCDFNQMLDLPLALADRPRIHISELQADALDGRAIAVADHCYGCTAGQGSSCGGALD